MRDKFGKYIFIMILVELLAACLEVTTANQNNHRVIQEFNRTKRLNSYKAKVQITVINNRMLI